MNSHLKGERRLTALLIRGQDFVRGTRGTLAIFQNHAGGAMGALTAFIPLGTLLATIIFRTFTALASAANRGRWVGHGFGSRRTSFREELTGRLATQIRGTLAEVLARAAYDVCGGRGRILVRACVLGASDLILLAVKLPSLRFRPA